MFMVALIAVALTAQSQASFIDPLDSLDERVHAQQEKDVLDAAKQRNVALEERQFLERYNDLVRALRVFSSEYSAKHVIDVKKVQAIRKAYRNLEKADSWFKADLK